MSKVFALIAILFVTFQPVMVPVVYAVDSWTGKTWSGDPWEGNPWEGNPWDGSRLEWEGDPWIGKSTEGETWSGKMTDGDSWAGDGTDGASTDGQDWTGYDWESVPWYLKGWNQTGFNGESWNQKGWIGNGSSGNPWLNSGWEGNGTAGNPWLNPSWTGLYGPDSPWMMYGQNGYGTIGNPWAIPGWSGNETLAESGIPEIPNFYDTEGFQIGEYVVKDIINGQAQFINAAMIYQEKMAAGEDVKFGVGSARKMFGNMVVNGMKLGVGSNFITDAYDTATHVEDGINAVSDFQKARDLKRLANAGNVAEAADDLTDAVNAGDTLSDISNTTGKMGALSKLNVGVAALGTGVSAVKTYNSIDNAVETFNSDATGAEKTSAAADVGANLGDTLMNAGIVTSAIPGGQVIGAGMAAAGAGLWVISKGVKLFANNWKGSLGSTAKSLAKKAGNAIKDGAKKAWDTVTGWFS
ncbi:hypothetical protein [Virgibacillus kekensis]